MTMTPEEERAVLARIGDEPSAFGDIFDAYYPTIITYAVRRTGSITAAEDVASTTFLKAFDHIASYTPGDTSILAWLYRIAGNVLKDYYRSSVHQATGLTHDEIISLADRAVIDESEILQRQIDRERDFQYVRQKLLTLPHKYQEIIMLHYTEGLKIREIAAITGRREGTVKSILSRGIRRLQELCNQSEPRALYLVGGINTNATKQEPYEAQ